MTEVARGAWCRTTDVAQVHAVLREHGFVILPADGPRHSLEDLMATLGEPVEYKFGKRLTIAPEQESHSSQLSHRGMPLGVLAVGGVVQGVWRHLVGLPDAEVLGVLALGGAVDA